MLSGTSRETTAGRRARVSCRYCGQLIELSRMRTHLRDAHQLVSSDLESSFLKARREARRTSRSVRR